MANIKKIYTFYEEEVMQENTSKEINSTKKQLKISLVVNKLIDSVLTGVLFAIAASLLTSAILGFIQNRYDENKKLENISNIKIGCSKEWTDEKFGVPQFIGQVDDYSFCAYLLDDYLIQIAFDESHAAQGYTITTLSTENNLSINLKEMSLWWAETDLLLGDFSFYDFPQTPEEIEGWLTFGGSGRVVYYENYYFAAKGNYYEYAIGFVDYGARKSENYRIGKEDYSDDEITQEALSGDTFYPIDRKTCFPNTFGVFRTEELEIMIYNYQWFDTSQLLREFIE